MEVTTHQYAIGELLSQLLGSLDQMLLRGLVVALLLAWFWFAGSWSLAIVRRDPSERTTPLRDIVTSISTGVAISIIAWTACLHVGVSVWGGTAVIALAAGLVLVRARDRIAFALPKDLGRVFFVVTALALLIGFWQFGAVETEVSGNRLFFNDRHRDVAAHLHMSGLIAESGLPRISTYGLTGETFHPLVHSGYAVLVIGARSLGISPFAASTCLWIAAYVVLAWAALVLAASRVRHAVAVVVAAILPLCWGPLYPPNLSVIDDLAGAVKYLQVGWPSGNMYHNLPQAWAVAMTAAAFVAFDDYARAGEHRARHLALACAAFVAGGWIKPSLAFLFGPGLVIVLLLRRAPIHDVAIVLGAFGVGVLGYMLPSFVAELPAARGWEFAPDQKGIGRVSWYFGICGGVALAAVVAYAVALARRQTSSRSAWVGLAIVAAGGGAMFALVFRESGLGGQPNLLWGASGFIALFSTFVVCWCAGDGEVGAPKPLRIAAWVLVGVQALNGLNYASLYPRLNVRHFPAKAREVMQFAHDHTAPTDRFLVDVQIEDHDGMPYLARPVLRGVKMIGDAGIEEYMAWRQFQKDGSPDALEVVQRRDAVLLDGRRRAALRRLAAAGWTKVEGTPWGYELWLRD